MVLWVGVEGGGATVPVTLSRPPQYPLWLRATYMAVLIRMGTRTVGVSSDVWAAWMRGRAEGRGADDRTRGPGTTTLRPTQRWCFFFRFWGGGEALDGGSRKGGGHEGTGARGHENEVI